MTDEPRWSGWACQMPGKLPRLYGAREIAGVNHCPEEGDRLIQLVEVQEIPHSRDPRTLAVLENGEVVIRLTPAALRYATEKSDIFFQCAETGEKLVVTSDEALTKSFIDRLNEEAEDGSTPILRMFDKAIEKLVDQGDAGIEVENEGPHPDGS